MKFNYLIFQEFRYFKRFQCSHFLGSRSSCLLMAKKNLNSIQIQLIGDLNRSFSNLCLISVNNMKKLDRFVFCWLVIVDTIHCYGIGASYWMHISVHYLCKVDLYFILSFTHSKWNQTLHRTVTEIFWKESHKQKTKSMT